MIGKNNNKTLNACMCDYHRCVCQIYVNKTNELNDYFYDFLSFLRFSFHLIIICFLKCINEIDCYHLKIK